MNIADIIGYGCLAVFMLFLMLYLGNVFEYSGGPWKIRIAHALVGILVVLTLIPAIPFLLTAAVSYWADSEVFAGVFLVVSWIGLLCGLMLLQDLLAETLDNHSTQRYWDEVNRQRAEERATRTREYEME